MDFKESVKKVEEQGRELAKEIVAKIPAEPGWRACIVLPGKDLEDGKQEYHLSLPSISHWGIRRPSALFGPLASCEFDGPLFGAGEGAAPIPMSEDGLALLVDGFWGLAAPHESQEEVLARFRVELDRLSNGARKKSQASAEKAPDDG